MLSKIIVSVSVSLLVSVTAFAQNTASCFTASNVEQISIEAIDEVKTIEAVSAKMSITPANGPETYGVMTMSIQGKTGEHIKVMGFDFNETQGLEFRVECDGGGVQLRNAGVKSLEANTGYMAGEVVNVAGEGCGMVRIAMNQVNFTQNACEQE